MTEDTSVQQHVVWLALGPVLANLPIRILTTGVPGRTNNMITPFGVSWAVQTLPVLDDCHVVSCQPVPAPVQLTGHSATCICPPETQRLKTLTSLTLPGLGGPLMLCGTCGATEW